jgi:hypothetical protein
MPRFVIPSHVPSPKHERYVKRLVQEFSASSTRLQPVILEEQVPATKSRHVHVIWDAWKGLTDEQRSAVIVDAYAEAEGREAADEITIAEGVTPSEALALGLLSFKVVPARKRNDPIPLEAYQAALAAEARNTLLGAKAGELRFARVADAEQALTRLRQALPGSSWSVVQEVATES